MRFGNDPTPETGFSVARATSEKCAALRMRRKIWGHSRRVDRLSLKFFGKERRTRRSEFIDCDHHRYIARAWRRDRSEQQNSRAGISLSLADEGFGDPTVDAGGRDKPGDTPIPPAN
jgi:hypothetical protein